MFKQWFSKKMESKYVRTAVCVIITAALAFFLVAILIAMKPLALKFGKIIVAILKPLVFGLMMAYLLSPLVRWLDHLFQQRFGQKKWIRPVSVALCLAAVIGMIALILGLLISAVANQVSQIDIQDIKDLFHTTTLDVDSFLNTI